MMNSSVSSSSSYFILRAYIWVGPWRYPCFLLTAFLYVLILFVNTLLIVVICQNRTLHEPMYFFLCSLFVNEIYGSTGLFPVLLLQLLRDIHTISTSLCFLQIYCLYTYVNVEYCNLALMAYDRYLAICFPLKYTSYMSNSKVLFLIIFIWLYCFIRFTVTLSLSLRLTLCGNSLDSVYCHNYLVAKLACSGSRVIHIYGLFATAVCIVVPLIPLLFSYFEILKVCFRGSEQTRQKALSTCMPHFASLLNFSFGSLFGIIQSRFDMSGWPAMVRILMSLYFMIMQPVFNPIMYGVKMTQIRNACKKLLSSKNAKK